MADPPLYACPCCGYYTLTEPPLHTYLICPICFWEDAAPIDPWRYGPSNQVNLLQAQLNFAEFGACEREWINHVRASTPGDQRIPGWQPLELVIQTQPSALLRRFAPSETVLFDWLRPQINDTLLAEIADADYGMEAEAHFQALKHIRNRDKIPAPLAWVPREVLDLTRWSEPDNVTWKQSGTGVPGHLMRLFCCAVLLRAAAVQQYADTYDGENETIVQLVASALKLGRDAIAPALSLLSWRVLSLPGENDERPFFAVGILLLAASVYRAEQNGEFLRQLSDWVMVEEARSRIMQTNYYGNPADPWLLGLTYHAIKQDTWKALAHQVLIDPPQPHPTAAAAILHNIGTRVVQG